MEYVGVEGEAVTVIELDRYIKVSEDFYVPTHIKIIRRLTSDKTGFCQYYFENIDCEGDEFYGRAKAVSFPEAADAGI